LSSIVTPERQWAWLGDPDGPSWNLSAWSPFRLNLYHWRVSQGPEVDVVAERTNGRVVGIEAKATDAVDLKDFKGLIELRDSLGDQFVHGYVFHSGRGSLAFGDRLTALPISAMWDR
jgi:predicted AAA+ superfamily ATPase